MSQREFKYRDDKGGLTVRARQAVTWYMAQQGLKLSLSLLPEMHFRTRDGGVVQVSIHLIIERFEESKRGGRRKAVA